MPKYRKKPVVVEAVQWWRRGDHPKVGLRSGPEIIQCNACMRAGAIHGWVQTLEGGHIVCPGDWIITGIAGEHYPCKPDIFEQTYELVEED